MNKIYRVLIVDDEAPARSIIEGYVQEIPNLLNVGSFHDAFLAYEFIQKNDPIDIAFLDINMPKLNGLQLAQQFDPKPAIVFTTAYSEYALEGFEKDAVDYLLKPIGVDRFLRAMNKAYKYLGAHHNNSEDVHNNDLEIKVDGLKRVIDINQIMYFQSFGNYLKLFTDTEMVLVQETIKQMEAKLKVRGFIRTHRSYLVNKKYITAYEHELTLTDSRKIPIGNMYKKMVRHFMQNDLTHK